MTSEVTVVDGGDIIDAFKVAVDNVIVGEIADNNLLSDKVVFGDWNQEDYGAGVYDFSQVPLGQVSEVKASAVVSNFGFNDQENVDFDLQLYFEGAAEGDVFNADVPSETLISLDKDTLTTTTTFVPSATGTVSMEMTVTSTTGDDNPADDMASASMMITETTYARDNNAAEAFVDPETAYEFGNLFDFYANQMVGGIDYAVGAGSEVGAVIYGTLYEFIGLDGDGAPELEFLGINTVFYEITEADLNGVGEANFVSLGFEDGAQELEGGKTYLAVIVTDGTTVRTPVSGTNVWVASWMNDGDWGSTLSIPMVRLNMDASINVEETSIDSNELNLLNTPNPATANTVVTFNMPAANKVTLDVFDINGKLVISENLGVLPSGSQTFELNVSTLEAGLYNYSLTVGGVVATSKMIVE